MDNRRTFLALLLSFAVIMLWGTFFVPPPPRPLVGPPAPSPHPAASATGASGAAGTSGEDGAAVEATPVEGRGDETAVSAPTEMVVHVRNGVFDATLRGAGGVLSSLTLERYAAAPPRPGQAREPMELVGPPSAEPSLRPLSVTTGDRALDAKLAAASFVIEGGDTDVRPGESVKVVMRWSDGAGSRVEKTLEFRHGSYVIDVSVSARVAGARATYLVLGPGLAGIPEPQHKSAYAERASVELAGAKVERVARQAFPVRKLEKAGPWPPKDGDWLRTLDGLGQVRRFSGARWAGLDENYFAALAFAEGPLPEVLVFPVAATDLKSEDGKAKADPFARTGMLLELPQASDVRRFSLYCGPKETETLRAVRPDLAGVVELGFFQWFGLYLLVALKFFYRYVGNYGIAIILLTLCVKIAFLPLTIKQLNTMQKLAKLRPQLKEIENRYGRAKGDARDRMEASRKMREEQMELYAREGVNPAGGCLPLLLQLPVLWAFYSLLGASIELRHAPFCLWILDLSAREVPPAAWFPLPVLPGLMLISMIVLQTLTPSTADPAQQKMMYIMPLFFAFIFKDLASGLVLYWLTQNVLSILQQVYMNKLAKRRERREKENRRLRKA